MSKNHLLSKKLCGLAGIAFGAMLFASCAQGFDSNETWGSNVTNTQLVSPELTDGNFSTKIQSDGSEVIQVTWDVIHGAGGYECLVLNTDDPANPVEVVNDTIDGTSFTFKKQEDSKYQVSIKTLGNAKYNNTDAENATIYAYSTMIPAQIIPAGEEISSFIASHIVETTDEQAFELEIGAEYECNGEIDFQSKPVTLRGNKVTRPIVKFGKDGVIRTSAALKVKYINFDCAEQGNKGGVIEMSANPPASASAEAQGIGAGKNSGNPADVYVLMDPIVIQNCAFKDVNVSLFSVGNCSWGISDIRVTDCMVQLKNDGNQWSDGAIFSGYSKGFMAPSGGQFYQGCIKNITVKNSTFVNIVENKKNNRFIRFNHKDIDRVFPTADGSATFENCTMYKTFSNKEFGNNTPNAKTYTINFNNNICYDVFRLQKFIQGNCTNNVDPSTNTICGISNPVDGTDNTKWATEEADMSFAGPCEQSLDFSKPNYGVDFRPTSALSANIGDPNWRE